MLDGGWDHVLNSEYVGGNSQVGNNELPKKGKFLVGSRLNYSD